MSTNNPGSISQSNSGSMTGGMQAVIGNNNNQAMSSQGSAVSSSQQDDIVKILTEIERVIHNSEIPERVKEKNLSYIKAAKSEISEEEPDRQILSKHLERVSKSVAEVDKTMDSSVRITEKVSILVAKISTLLTAMNPGLF